MDEVEKLLEVNRQAFLNQATYEAAIMTCVQNLPKSTNALKGLCELNSKRFLPYWGIVMEKVTFGTSSYFSLFQSMLYGIRPFLDNRSSYKPSTSCAFESLSQSIERHLQRIIEWTNGAYKSDLQALRLARIILKHTGRCISCECKELVELLRQKRSAPEWEEELCKFICLLNTTETLNDDDFMFLESLCNEHVMKALVRRSPARYKDSISAFNDEIVVEYILGSFECDPPQSNISPVLFERALGHGVQRLISMMHKMSWECLVLLLDYKDACLVELCKNAPAQLHSLLLDKCLSARDFEALANLLNLDSFDPALIPFEEIKGLLNNRSDFVALRCWNGLLRKGFAALPSSVIDYLTTCFNDLIDAKSLILACMILKQVGKRPTLEEVSNKLSEFESNLRVCKHLQNLLE